MAYTPPTPEQEQAEFLANRRLIERMDSEARERGEETVPGAAPLSGAAPVELKRSGAQMLGEALGLDPIGKSAKKPMGTPGADASGVTKLTHLLSNSNQ